MIRFSCMNRHQDGTPIVTDRYVTAYAERILSDYQPERLLEPGIIDGLHFLEHYLKANVEFFDLYRDDDVIAGVTIFNDERIKVFDRDLMRTKWISVPAGTIIIDNSTMKEGKEGFALFTQFHEAGHFCMHQEVYQEQYDPWSMDAWNAAVRKEDLAARQVGRKSSAVFCKRSVIAGDVKQKNRGWNLSQSHKELITQEDFREHQSNVFAAAIILPEKPFQKLVLDSARKNSLIDGYSDCILLRGDRTAGFDFRLDCVVEQAAEAFGVSRLAVKVQMRNRGLVKTEEEYFGRKYVERRDRRLWGGWNIDPENVEIPSYYRDPLSGE